MSYATIQDLIDRFGEAELIDLSDRAGTGALDADVVQRALDDAAELIDGYLAKRYRLPLASVPGRLTALACDIARYRLHTEQSSAVVDAAWADAQRWLRDVADGRAVLEADGVEPVAPQGGASVQFDQVEPAFTTDSMRGW